MEKTPKGVRRMEKNEMQTAPNWTELLEREYADKMSQQLVTFWRAEGKTDEEIYNLLEELT